ncbi:hypothetical protein A1O1_09141 [Capronia coronata CBS 617.96]|uniref:Transcription factor domain-containing protein n=1 Tax=Capronia coronata CBS 617.96 TaxID=1182541 RepID=W9Y8K5_9EURO|nr:uncharacterized protein A1O1_09141 [Capronia coronata CBS 617.96]EXJ78739.1 hypothetical protein A1O1_09141 [Capronia coronata CBS 617.96]
MENPDHTSHQRFTFLNYNTPTHSASHRRAVKSHISSKYRAAIRQKTHSRYALPHHDEGSEGLSSITQEDRTQKDEQRRKVKTYSESPSTLPGLSWHSAPFPLNIGFSGTRVDPFSSLPGQQTPCVVGALDYYTNVLAPLHQPMLVVVNQVNPTMSWALPVILSHDSAFHGAIALSQAYLEKHQNLTTKPSQEVRFHRHKAVSILRNRLADLEGPPDDGTLVAVLALAILDVMYKEDDMSNRKGLALMVAMKGGLDNLGKRGLVKAYLIQFDYFWTLETGTESIFPLAKRKKQRIYPHFPFQDNVLSMIATLPPGFAAIARRGSLGIDVLQVLSRVSRFMRSQASPSGLATEKDPIPGDQDYPDIFDACSCLQSAAATEHSLEKNICLAIILYSFNMDSQGDSHTKLASYRGSRQELTRSLPFTRGWTPEERQCLIWIWMIVITSWRTDHALSGEGLWLSHSFFSKIEDARSWESVETAMRQFFWSEPLSEVWKTSWREAFNHHDRIDPLDSRSPSESPPLESGNLPMMSSPSTYQWIQDSTTLSTRCRGTGGDSLSTHLQIPGIRHGIQEHVAIKSEKTALSSPHAIKLPRMLTLDTYLGQIQ